MLFLQNTAKHYTDIWSCKWLFQRSNSDCATGCVCS